MKNRWPPEPESGTVAADPSRMAELHARLLAQYWDDCDSEESNLELIGWWLAQTERERRLS